VIVRSEPITHFQAELPIPRANLEAYETIYAIEQWLRRILYAALLAEHGSRWRGALPADLASELKKRLALRDRRAHLSCENSNNLIWFLTVDELRTMLEFGSIWRAIRKLTHFSRGPLISKTEELREIRNVIGHSRAAGVELLTVLEGVRVSLEPGIERFKRELLYPHYQINLNEDSMPESAVMALFESEVPPANDWSKFQPFLSETDDFFMATSLPVARVGSYVRVSQALDEYEQVAGWILALMLNKSGDEFSVVWPKANVDLDQHRKIIQLFMANARSIWTETEYERQAPQYVCHPAIWFYENQAPIRE
jgi:hypothetical protein